MSDADKEAIRTERSNYAKRKLSAVATDDSAQNGQSDHLQPQDKAIRFADASSAGDQMSRRNRSLLGQVRSGLRYLRSTSSVQSIAQSHHEANAFAEMDSHADTVVAGSTCKILELTEKSCDVYPYANSYEPIKNVLIAKVATAYDHPSGETFIIIFGQALYMGENIDHSLICPNQARSNGIIIDDDPKHLSPG
jgi:3'-phosphoadenosine 5'-phosphosulfate (PAPS) 3'-phosphatase